MNIEDKRSFEIKVTEVKKGDLDKILKVIELWKKSAVITGYDEEGKKWSVIAGAGREEKDISKFIDERESIDFDIFDLFRECHDTEVKRFEIASLTLLRAFGSPSCIISIPPGPPICIC